MTSRNNDGFALVESLLIILIVLVLGFGGYYVYHAQHQAKVTTTAQKSTSSAAATQSPAPSANTALITSAVKSNCEATAGSVASQIAVTKVEGDYAEATVVCTDATTDHVTGRDYLKKNSGSWVVVLKGGGVPTTSSDLASYGFPPDFLN
jgi:hypothetical protein